jgi:hypothetical protein
MTYAGEALAADFRIAAVISQSQRILLGNVVPFTALTCAATIPFIGLNLAADWGIIPGTRTNIFYSLLAMEFLQAFAMAVILHTAFQHMRGRSAQPVEAISRALTSSLAFVCMVLLGALASRRGSFLPWLTSLVLMASWCFALPVHVVEKIGPLKSLDRGVALTKGFRLKIVALFLLYFGFDAAVDQAVAAVAPIFSSFWVNILAEDIWESLSCGFGAILIATTYHYLRIVKEGIVKESIDVERIGAVFD